MQHPPPLPAENQGISPEDYKDLPLPEDYEIVELLSNVIMCRYLDVAEDGKSLVRNGIILPNQVVDQRAWRVGEVVLAGPDCRQVKKGSKVIFPGDKGLQGLRQGNEIVIFLSEDRIFGICEPQGKLTRKAKK
jgi:co-chaperonin GroES (HSP10)